MLSELQTFVMYCVATKGILQRRSKSPPSSLKSFEGQRAICDVVPMATRIDFVHVKAVDRLVRLPERSEDAVQFNVKEEGIGSITMVVVVVVVVKRCGQVGTGPRSRP